MNTPSRVAFIVTLDADLLKEARAKAQRERITDGQMATQALAAWCGHGKPIPIPVPFIITKIEP